jgi:V/A-type H+/Na+-transporting ATPase subunit D
MAKFRLSKSALQEQRSQLRLYEKLLPSLDLKRRQLLGELKKAQHSLARARDARSALEDRIGDELPMLAEMGASLAGLVRVRDVRVGTENVAGVKVPRLQGVDFEVARYSLLATPAFTDRLVARLQEAAEQRVRLGVEAERVRVLEGALRRITQRVNLFGHVLIPRARQQMKRIQIHLSDLEREGVVRSKLSKARHLVPPAVAGEGSR